MKRTAKKLFTLTVVLGIILATSVGIAAADIKIYINGNEFIPLDAGGNLAAPFIEDGTTYVAGRALFEAYGLPVEYDADSNTAIFGDMPEVLPDTPLENGQIRVILNQQETVFYDVNGTEVAPILKEGTTYFPLRGVSENLGLAVNWDSQQHAVLIEGTIETVATSE